MRPRARHVTDIQIRRHDDAERQSLGAGYAIADLTGYDVIVEDNCR